MKLKALHIQHKQYYASRITDDKYDAKVEFFNDKGEALSICLREDQLLGIVELCSAGLIKAAQEASQSIIASLNPVLQIESLAPDKDTVPESGAA